MEQLSGMDAAFVYAETAGAAHVTFFGIYDPSTAPGGEATVDGILAHIGSRLGVDSLFRSVLARVPFDLDHPYWVRDENFDISKHLHHLTLPRPGGWRRLCDQVAELHAQKMDLRRPPWEGYFIDGLGKIRGLPEGAFALCLKLHHAAIDGTTGLDLINAFHDPTADTTEAPEDDWNPERHPSSLNLLARTAFTYARRPGQLVSAAAHSVPLLAKIPGAMTRLVPNGHRSDQEHRIDVPHSLFNSHTDSSRNFDARDYDLDAVLKVRTLVPEATFNDVVLTGVGGAMRRFLLEKDELPEKSLVTAIAMELHSSHEGLRGANQLSVVRVALGTDIDDPIARLKVVRESSAHAKAMGEEVGERLMEYAEFVSGAFVVPALRIGMATHASSLLDTSRIANTLVSTMRGSASPIYAAGAQLVAGYALSPFVQGNGLIHDVISYGGRVFVSINGCPTVLPDIEHYADCLEASFTELLSSATA